MRGGDGKVRGDLHAEGEHVYLVCPAWNSGVFLESCLIFRTLKVAMRWGVRRMAHLWRVREWRSGGSCK